jgi:hypothetical protein
MLAVAAQAVAAFWESMPSLGWEEIVRDVQSAAAAQSISRAAGDPFELLLSMNQLAYRSGDVFMIPFLKLTVGGHHFCCS